MINFILGAKGTPDIHDLRIWPILRLENRSILEDEAKRFPVHDDPGHCHADQAPDGAKIAQPFPSFDRFVFTIGVLANGVKRTIESHSEPSFRRSEFESNILEIDLDGHEFEIVIKDDILSHYGPQIVDENRSGGQ